MREVVVRRGQLAAEDLPAHDVVLDVALAVAPGHGAVVTLLEAHHHASPVDAVDVVDGLRVHRPADLALGVDDEVDRVVVPLQSATHRVVPHRARALAGLRQEVVDEVQAVGELGLDLVDLGLGEEGRALGLGAGGVGGHRAGVDGVGLLDALILAGDDLGVLDLHRVGVVGVQAEHRDAAVGLQVTVGDRVLDLLAAGLGHDAHQGALDGVAAITDDGRQRRDLVGVDHHLAELALDAVVQLGAAGSADGQGGLRQGDAHHGGGEGNGGQAAGSGSRLHEFLLCG